MLPRRMNRAALSALSGLLLLATACGTDVGTAPSELKIIGGKAASTGEWPSAVAITRDGLISCSAVVVAPRLVVTAAHCLRGIPTDGEGRPTKNDIRIYVGLGKEGGQIAGAHPVARIGIHPLYAKTKPYAVLGKSDIGYLVTEETLPVAPAPLALDALELRQATHVDSAVELVGFGFRDPEGATGEYGLKFHVPTKVQGAYRGEFLAGGPDGDACSGDSGGPAYAKNADGTWLLVGLSSRGPSPCGKKDSPGKWTTLAEHVCWLERASGERVARDEKFCAERQDPYTEAELARLSFASLCPAEQATAAQRHTVAMLREAVAKRGESARDLSCEETERRLNAMGAIDLSGRQIRDLSPLIGLDGVKHLSLARNWIRDPAPLLKLNGLASVDLTANNIASAAALAPLTTRGVNMFGLDTQMPELPDASK